MRRTFPCGAYAIAAFLLAASLSGRTARGAAADGWAPKFYAGLEAVGSVTCVTNGFKEGEHAIRLAWESGAMKFGVAKAVTTELTGFVDWVVSAQVKSEGDFGYAGAALEFFDAAGKSIGIVNSRRPVVSKTWKRAEWTFSAPKTARKYAVHLLSLNREPVLFAQMRVASRPGVDKGDIPMEVTALPAEWNKDWNGGTVRMLNFSDAPLPVSFYVRGRRRELKNPRLEVDVPEDLEVREACCPHAAYFGRLAFSTAAFETNGARLVRHVFADKALFKRMRPTFMVDAGFAVKLVIAPKPGCAADGRAFTIRYRTMDGEKRGEEKAMEMAFRRLPEGLRTSRNFFVFSWNNNDRHFADDAVALAAARAYEAAGLRSFRLTLQGGEFDRKKELAALYAGRPVPYVFSARFGDLWRLGPCGLGKASAKALGVRRAVSSDPHYASHAAGKMCPEYFIADPAFREHLRGFIRRVLARSGVRDGDWVTLDMEPWHSGTWCHCEACHKAFAAFAGLDHVPSADEIKARFADTWARFRCRHNEKSVELVTKLIREYNPTLKCIDYDYIMPYGDEAGMMARRRGCGKDTQENEKWLDGHLCSYYHRIDKDAFLAMRNNVRHLRKPYVPMAALCGNGSYLRPGEVLNPRQIRQFALAAFVNGCPGYAFYSGVCYDGDVLVKMMEAQDEVARYEGLPWGTVDGTARPACESERFAYASTVRPDGSEVVALFNYDADDAIRVSLDGQEHAVGPWDVKFVETGRRISTERTKP